VVRHLRTSCRCRQLLLLTWCLAAHDGRRTASIFWHRPESPPKGALSVAPACGVLDPVTY